MHFYAASEFEALFTGHEALPAPRIARTWRRPRARGQWSQWETIYRKPV
jgi:hypothetical protein